LRSFTDDTYMYDDSAVHVMRGHHQGHWYDEPPYESDPDDFLMTGIHRHGPAAMIQVKHIIPKYIKKILSLQFCKKMA
jgi:hypothetical protein